MPFVFKPAIYTAGELYQLPRPVKLLRLQDAWDFEHFKVPLAEGDFTAGHSRNGVDILVEGEFGALAGELTLTEQQMFEALEELRDALDVAAAAPYEFFLYHDPDSALYRCFKHCSTARFEYDLSRKQLFTYSLVIHAGDPNIYNTPPGE